ncbi:MAG: aminoacyl-tRNA deacylase [Candidatus Promineifilaceae bacterium]|nr:aminoacyl-tRNA deacylase [Candidatus Promineifilaceae bacterium]
MARKTIAMRLLEGKGIPYEAITYPDDERDAVRVAEHVGAPPHQVFKTLVVVRERGKPFLAMVPADSELDLKQMARAVGEKKLSMASHAEAERLTRLQVGGISALALINRGFDMVLDASAQQYEAIYISAGEKGIQIRVPVEGLVALTSAQLLSVAAD